MIGILTTFLGGIALLVGLQLFSAWLVWLCLGVVLPAFGLTCPGFWVVFCGWFLVTTVLRLMRGRSP